MAIQKSKSKKSPHYKNLGFLTQLGTHCRKLRTQKGYSISRLSKESESLSMSVIHRLETGGSVEMMSLLRFAETLEVRPKDLFNFDYSINPKSKQVRPKLKLVSSGDSKTHLPVYSIKAAAGYFGEGQDAQCLGWVKVQSSKKFDKNLFVVQVTGQSMEPKILNGDYAVMRANPVGSRQGKIVLAQYRGPADPDTGGSYTIKRYQSKKVTTGDQNWRHEQIKLLPLNPDFDAITLPPQEEHDFKIIAECVGILDSSGKIKLI